MSRDAYIESCVLSADPLELICLVYAHGIEAVRDARRFLADGDIASRSQAINRAIDALSELEGSLDLAAGGEISRNLAELYRYIRQRLTEGSMRQADGPLAEVQSLLMTLAEAWTGIRQAESAGPTHACPPPQAGAWMDRDGGSAHAWSA